jgi:hypothetical protein
MPTMHIEYLPGDLAEPVRFEVKAPDGMPPATWDEARPIWLAVARGALYSKGVTRVTFRLRVAEPGRDRIIWVAASDGWDHDLSPTEYVGIKNKEYWARMKRENPDDESSI